LAAFELALMTRRRIDDLSNAMTFYAALGLDVRYFAALWHTFNVGHILATDLDRICRHHGLSIADFNLLGALRIDRPQRLRPTDLAATLHVSQAALSARISRLERDGLLVRSPAVGDRRASTLQLTPEGARIAEVVFSSIERDSKFVHQFNGLSEEDQLALARIMGKLHTQLDREVARSTR
jgi:DNA-binding MarR family transcriptional regulator